MSKTSTADFNKKVAPKSTYAAPNSAVGADSKTNNFRSSQDPIKSNQMAGSPMKQG